MDSTVKAPEPPPHRRQGNHENRRRHNLWKISLDPLAKAGRDGYNGFVDPLAADCSVRSSGTPVRLRWAPFARHPDGSCRFALCP